MSRGKRFESARRLSFLFRFAGSISKHKRTSVPRPRLPYSNSTNRCSWSNSRWMAERIDMTYPLCLDMSMMISFLAALKDDIVLPVYCPGGETTVAWPVPSVGCRRAC